MHSLLNKLILTEHRLKRKIEFESYLNSLNSRYFSRETADERKDIACTHLVELLKIGLMMLTCIG